jgi:hypothetical protein|tara:strand:- start:2477 stop:2806 length:330 start_codon:yes stop_codon:yes gene_type:complete
MNKEFETFQGNISAVQSAFNALDGNKTDKDLYDLKDGTFDAISRLSEAMPDADLKQLLARAAVDVHLFPIGREGWQESLIETVEFAIATCFQTIAFLSSPAYEHVDLAA